MKKLILLLLFVFLSCGELPENYFSYNEPMEKNEDITLIMQFHDYISESNKYFDNYKVGAVLYASGVGGEINLKIDRSFYDYIKKFGVGNYPDYEVWIEAMFKDCINQTKVSSIVNCDITEFKF